MKSKYTKILESKSFDSGHIIVRESCVDYPANTANIYCINKSGSIVWFAELPFEDDCYPNPVAWNARINKNADSWENYYERTDNMFSTSSRKGITVTIDNNNGKIVDSELTK